MKSIFPGSRRDGGDASARDEAAEAKQQRPRREFPRLTRANLPAAAAATTLCLVCMLPGVRTQGEGKGDSLTFDNPDGAARTVNVNGGALDLNNPFFQSLGANDRACVTCHQPAQAWSITPEHVRERFEKTDGTDPLFRLVDGANSPAANVSTVKNRRKAYSLLLSKALIRVGLPIPPNAEFELIEVDDPYQFASTGELSLYRRPLPTTNLRFISAVMWDGRESVSPMTIQPHGSDETANIEALLTDLMTQSNSATRGHAEAASDLTPQQKRQIVDFQMGLFTAQVRDKHAGSLDQRGGVGGPDGLTALPFYIGINDNVADPYGPFRAEAMGIYDGWARSSQPHRRSIARGQALFNTRPITITGVKGLNDNPYFGSPAVVVGTCTTCHNTPNVGNHSLAVPLDIGIADGARRTPDLPLYTLRNRTTGETVQTTDPGRALISGKWADIGKFKGPILRGLAARAPYFHNGSAATLEKAVEFYDERFGMNLTPREKEDLTAFLKTL